MIPAGDTEALREQLDYYRARAGEYDEWWRRTGRYDRGAATNARWFEDAAAVQSELERFRPSGRVLELACGTGIWTEKLLGNADSLTAVDGSPEMLAINRARVGSPRVRYLEANLFEWKPEGTFDTVFFGFWLSHIPPERFDAFWGLVRNSLAPGGRVFFVDSLYHPTSTAMNHQLPDCDATILKRRLNDGREYRVYKVFYDPDELRGRLAELGWQFGIRRTRDYFFYGAGGLDTVDARG